MSQPELLKKVVLALGEVGIDYMISGSIASSLQGEPRATHDIDLIVEINQPDAQKLKSFFIGPDYYLDDIGIARAIEDETMFNLIDVNSGDTVDFWMLTDSDFDQSRFARKYLEKLAGAKMNVSRPEDTILAKLKWAKDSGGSAKQVMDALRGP